jgi:hypothetical protein
MLPPKNAKRPTTADLVRDTELVQGFAAGHAQTPKGDHCGSIRTSRPRSVDTWAV